VPRRSKLALLKSTFNAESFIRRLYWSISSDFDAVQSWNVCGRPKSRKKFTKNAYFGVKGRSRSSMLVPPESSLAVVVVMRSKSVSTVSATVLLLDWDEGKMPHCKERLHRLQMTGINNSQSSQLLELGTDFPQSVVNTKSINMS